VLERPKQGFGAPVARWLSTLRAIGERELLREPIFEHLEPAAVRQVIDGAQTTRGGFEFWVLLNFALWHRHWIEGEDIRESWPLPSTPEQRDRHDAAAEITP
jgi:asparagine synthase (glutamine-hydrolysing)